ncbi:helix-turn-helix domain-containing protein [Olegusella massiliensis]|uniref:helix-turn-helix domain-containing protein n=1 Tax=Olegusella massiliensis TaxID=1776381 RepID=UPI004055577E
MEYSKALRKVMAEQGVSAIELARRLNKTRGYVSQLMSGTISEPRLGRAFEISDALGVPLDKFAALMYEDETKKGEK